ncbi:MAG: lytic transglycosylase [Candidatus Moraniibacteriota bacterium]
MEKPPNPGRRLFLSGTAAGVAAGALWKLGADIKNPEQPPTALQPEKLAAAVPEQETIASPAVPEITATPEQKIMQQADEDVVAETLSEQLEHSDRVIINKDTIEAIYQKWYRAYSPGGARYKDMLNGLEKMRPWMEDIDAEFRKNNFPEAFKYLAIAESHFNIFAVSRVGASGPYQFTSTTAEKKPAVLVVTPTYDERIDPIKSAAACARLLAHNYGNFGGNNRSAIRYDKEDSALYLAIGGYNGAYPWRYKPKTARRYRSIPHYLSFVEKQINNIISTVIQKDGADRKHLVRPKETLSAIAKQYATTTETLMQTNALHSTALKVGQQLRIPHGPSSKKQRTLALRGALRDHNENLNYPVKVYAIIDVIKALGLEQKLATDKKLEFAEIPVKQDQHITLVHTVAQKETLYSLARKYAKGLGVTESALRQTLSTENRLGSTGALTIGQKITIGASSQTPTLEKLARDNNTSTDVLRAYNPAVLSPGNPLPPGVKTVRIPKKLMLAERP